MSALERAQAVLFLAIGPETASRASMLPALPSELIESWCGALSEPDRASDEKEVVLKALKWCRFTEGHERILRMTQALLLDPSSPSLRLPAGSCLLQYVSSASVDTLRLLTPTLVTTVTRALSPLQFQLPSAPSSTLPQLVSTLLRLLNALVLKLLLPSETVATLATLLSSWIHFGASASSGLITPSPSVAERGRVPAQSQLAFGVMSAFGQPPASPRRRTRAPSKASTTRSRAASIAGDSESESEVEGGKTRDRRRDAAQIRLDALVCLSSLAKSDPRALHQHWSLFLADSPYLRNKPTLFTLIEKDPSRSVRGQAVAALSCLLESSASYLAIAEDRPSKASFTSLSATVGEIVSGLHLSLSDILTLALVGGQVEARLALLDFAAKLAANSPYGRLHRPLASILAKSVLSSLNSPDPNLVSSAAATLTVIVTRYVATLSSQPFGWEELALSAEKLLEEVQQEAVRKSGWSVLAAVVPAAPSRDWTSTLSKLVPSSSVSSTTSSTLQAAQTSFVVSLIRLPPTSPPSTYLPAATTLLASYLHSRHSLVRLCACEALSSSSLLDPAVISTLDPWREALSLASTDPDEAVRAAAYRVIGLLVKLETLPRYGGEVREAIEVLLNELEGGKGEGNEAGLSWALANCCDSLQPSDVDSTRFVKLISLAVSLLKQESSEEATRISSFRILSTVLRLAPSLSSIDSALLESCISAVETGLSSPAAKIRWNAAITSSSLLLLLNSTTAPCNLALRLTSALAALLLADSSYKVRIHAVGALFVVPLASTTQHAAQQARNGLAAGMEEGRVPRKENAHAEVLLKRLDGLLARCSGASGSSPA